MAAVSAEEGQLEEGNGDSRVIVGLSIASRSQMLLIDGSYAGDLEREEKVRRVVRNTAKSSLRNYFRLSYIVQAHLREQSR